jgi:hypothetical protein
VQPVSVADAADELYGLSPAEFTAARDELSRQTRAAGQRDDAAAIKKLAKPTVSAWLVNQLARNAPDQIARLTEVGDALQEAQRALDGDRLRELSTERRQVVNDLLPEARRLARQAGQAASAGVLDEVRATLEAALADAGARDAVRSGRLTRALAYAGLGEVDLSAAMAVPASRAPAKRRGGVAEPEPGGVAGPEPAEPQSAESQTAERPAAAGARRAAAEKAGRARPSPAEKAAAARDAVRAEAVRAAEAEAADAASALAGADRKLAGVTERRQFLRRRIDGLKDELDQAIAEDAQLSRDVRQAQRERDAAARAEAGANLRLDRARQNARRR